MSCYSPHRYDGAQGRPHPADGYMIAPDGERVGGEVCREHGEAMVAEYMEKLGETWRFVAYATTDHDPDRPITDADLDRAHGPDFLPALMARIG